MSGKFDISGLDDVIHGRVRLGIVAYLASAEVADFTELKDLLEVTQGNLSVHLRKLEDAGYVAIDKRLRRPQAADPGAADRRGPSGLRGLSEGHEPAGGAGGRRIRRLEAHLRP